MSFVTIAASAFDNFKTAFPDAVVSVVAGSQTAQGLIWNMASNAELTASGDVGISSGNVMVKLADLNEPAKGATIKVAGKDVFVLRARVNKAAGAMIIEYSEQRPIEGALDIQ
jgi:hypothetical protein